MPIVKLHGVVALDTNIESFKTNITILDWIKGLIPISRRRINHLLIYVNGKEVSRFKKYVNKDDEVVFIAPAGGY